MRGARGLRDEFSTFHASAYPQLAAQTLAITGDAEITRAAAAATLARVWRSWASLRGTTDVLVRARWTAVLVAAERESTTPVRAQQASDAVEEITGGAVAADTVVVAALQRLPRVQRRALVLHYMGGVSVKHLSELSGSSAEHIELLLDDGFRALAGSLDWSAADEERPEGPDLSFDWLAEALADTATRLPAQIPALPPTALLRNAAVVRWSVRAIPVAGAAACAAVMAAVAQPEPTEVHPPAVYAQHGGGAEAGAPAYAARSDLVPEPVADGAPRPGPGPTVRLRSIALTSLLDTPARSDPPSSASPTRATRASAAGRVGGAAYAPPDPAAAADGPSGGSTGAAGGTDADPPQPEAAEGGTAGGPPDAATPGPRAATAGTARTAGGAAGAAAPGPDAVGVGAAGTAGRAAGAAAPGPDAVGVGAAGTAGRAAGALAAGPGAVEGGGAGAAAAGPGAAVPAGGAAGSGIAPEAQAGAVASASAQFGLPAAMAAPVPAPAAVVPNGGVPAAADPVVLAPAIIEPPSTAPSTGGPLTAPAGSATDPSTDAPTDAPLTVGKPAEPKTVSAGEAGAEHAATAAKAPTRRAAGAAKPTERPAAAEKSAARPASSAAQPTTRHADTTGTTDTTDTTDKAATAHTAATDKAAARDTRAERGNDRPSGGGTSGSGTSGSGTSRSGHHSDAASDD